MAAKQSVLSIIKGKIFQTAEIFPRKVHQVIQPIFARYGYQMEAVSPPAANGLKLGLWRKAWRKAPHPRRIFLLPGLGDTPLSWLFVTLPLQKVLSEQFDEMIFLDYPGFQGFLADQKPFTQMDVLLDSVAWILDEYQAHTVLGHSLGSWIAAHYAVRSAEKSHSVLKHTLLVSSPAVIPHSKDMLEWKAKFDIAREKGVDPFRPYLFVKEPIWFPLFAGEFERFFKKREILQFIDSIGRHHFINDKIHQIRNSVSLIWGREDMLNLASWAEGWSAGLDFKKTGPVPLVLIHDVGHNLHIEKPAAVSSAVSKILKGHDLQNSSKWTYSLLQSNRTKE